MQRLLSFISSLNHSSHVLVSYIFTEESKEGIVTLPVTKVSGRNLYLKVSYKGTGCFHLRLP